MTPQLNYVAAQHRAADFVRAAERARIARAGDPGGTPAHRARRRSGLLARLRVAPAGNGRCAEDPAR